MTLIMKKKDILIEDPKSDNSSIKDKEHSEINPQSEKIQSVALSFIDELSDFGSSINISFFFIIKVIHRLSNIISAILYKYNHLINTNRKLLFLKTW